MPHLITGHLRFTSEDFLMQEFKDFANTNFDAHSFESLIKLLKLEIDYLSAMKEREVVERFDTSKNVQKTLSTALALINAMAEEEGYDLLALMNNIIP